MVPLVTDEGIELRLQVQVRDIPAMRVARMPYDGPPAEIGRAFDRVTTFAVRHGVGPAGPLIGIYPRLEAGATRIEAHVLVPLTRLPESDEDAIETVRLPRVRAACLMYSGPMDNEFRRRHSDLFAWLDARELPRVGTAHHHAYIAGRAGSPDWTVEIRVPLVGGAAPAAPL